jgi:hypothetical protein
MSDSRTYHTHPARSETRLMLFFDYFKIIAFYVAVLFLIGWFSNSISAACAVGKTKHYLESN